MNLKDTAKLWLGEVKDFTIKNAPTILMIAGIIGSVSSTVEAIILTPKFEEKIEEKKNEKLVDKTGNRIADPENYDNSLNFWEKLSVALPVYWPVIVSEGAAIGCIIGCNNVNLKRQAALIAAYTLSENNLKDYKEKVKEIAGSKKADRIEETVRSEKMIEQYSPDAVIKTGHGDTLFYESACGRYFKSSIQEVTSALIRVNQHMLSNDVILNDLYSELDIPTTSLGEIFEFPGGTDAELLSTDLPVSKSEAGEPCLMIWLDIDDMERCV